VVGQIRNVNDPEDTLAQVPVALFRHAKLRTETVTNRFGEFWLECLLERGLYLGVSVQEGPELRIRCWSRNSLMSATRLNALILHRLRPLSQGEKRVLGKRIETLTVCTIVRTKPTSNTDTRDS